MQNVNCSDSSVSQQGLPFHPVVMTMKGNEKYKMNWRLQHSLSISAVEELLVLGETWPAEMAASADLGIWASWLLKTNKQRGKGFGEIKEISRQISNLCVVPQSLTCFSVLWGPCHLWSDTYKYSNVFLTSGMQGHFAMLLSLKMILHTQTAILVVTCIF